MARRSPARWLAPLALVASAAAVYAVVHDTVASDGKTSTSSGIDTQPHKTSTTSKTSTPHRRTYVVKPGDVLSAIAEKTGVSVAEIERLNPSVDAAALHPGQKLRLTE